MTLAAMTEVDIAIGIAGTDSMWDTSVSIISDTMHNTGYNNIIDTGVTHKSLASSLVTMVVKASPVLAASNAPGTYTMSLDYLTSKHFLDDTKFEQVSLKTSFTSMYKNVLNSYVSLCQYLSDWLTGRYTHTCSVMVLGAGADPDAEQSGIYQ
jgi:hypothetical protein